jgi:glycosyltransferase involved in cell wall biosynthesis
VRIFLAGTSFHPIYGGPARSVSRLAGILGEAGVDVGVWAPDGSALVTPFLPDNLSVCRLGGTEEEALRNFGCVNLIHDNGIWLPHNHRLAKLATSMSLPRVVSTRGMLEPWALNHKRWKKRLAWWFYQRRDLRSAALLHATAPSEASHLESLAVGRGIMMVPNGVDLLPTASFRFPSCGRKTALFVGRIYPVKGLPLLVEAWAKVRPSGWKMKIVGPDEDGHRAEVEALIRQAKLEADFEFTGALEGEALHRTYEEADLLILPSHTENFGMVVGEALAHGIPVITTHGTPWKLLETERCGWWMPVSADGLASALDDATRRSPEELTAMGERGRAVVVERFGWNRIAGEFISCYQWVLGAGAKPDCVVS